MAETSSEEIVSEKPHLNKQMYLKCKDSEVKEVVNLLIDKVAEEEICTKESDRVFDEVPSTDIANFVELEERDSVVEIGDSSKNEKMRSSKQRKSCNATKRIRSVSENESEAAVNAKDIIRRKFGSEGEILSVSENAISPQQRKEVNEVIGQYIDNLIKDSIFNAIKSVNVDSLYEDIMKDFSNRKSSVESENDFVMEQRLNSDSITELVELESTAISGNKKIMESRITDAESLVYELDDTDHASFVGYLADQEDCTSIDDIKSAEESLNSSMSSNLEQKIILSIDNQENSEKSHGNVNQIEFTQSSQYEDPSTDSKIISTDLDHVSQLNDGDSIPSKDNNSDEQQKVSSSESTCEQNEQLNSPEDSNELMQNLDTVQTEQSAPSQESTRGEEQKLSTEILPKSDEGLPSTENAEKQNQNITSAHNISDTVDLIIMSPEGECILPNSDSKTDGNVVQSPDVTESLPQRKISGEEQTKINWKVGYLHVKLPHKTRGKAHLKAWKKRRVIIQPDEFVNDPKNPSLVISVYGTDSKKHETTFWHSVSSQKAVVFRSSSRTHPYAFTISDGGDPIIHLSSDRESTTQEWMAGIRSVLWPPSPFMELEKMLSGREFEISIIDNEYSYHAGLLGMYGYFSITPKKLILLHPQQGYVIQEWYLNTVDKFHFVLQPKAEDMHKVLCMTTCKDSSTGQGELIFFCNEAVTFLQSLASNIHQVLSYHSKQEGGKYQKELEEIAEWLTAPPQDCLNVDPSSDEHYKVPPRQVKSLLDIPNFIFNKSLSPVASAIYPAPHSALLEPLDSTKNKTKTTSQDSGISTCTSSDDFLNCSATSFIIGGGPMTGKSSDSELSDAYTPPRTPETQKKAKCAVLKEEHLTSEET